MVNGLTGQILRAHSDGRKEGNHHSVGVDFVLLPEYSLALLLRELKTLGGKVWDKEKILVAVDHFSPPSTIERANIVKEVLSFIQEQDLPHSLVYQGICHQLLVEGPWVRPGSLVLGADSHTTTAGALGSFATGMGSTDILYTLVTGKIWLPIPETVRIDLTGKMPPYLRGKDIILHLLGRAGEGGYLQQALEFHDHEEGISMDDRFSICNMGVEGGATNGLFYPDRITWDYIEQREGRREDRGLPLDEVLGYKKRIEIQMEALSPKIALPHSPANVVDVRDAGKDAIQQVFIGSCTEGRISDLEGAARLLRKKKVAPRTRLLVTPASQKIYREAIEKGYIQMIVEAGGVILNPSCGPCGGIDKGLLGAGEKCVSTSNRNFQGRMGDPSSMLFLASSLTAAATALTGRITDPREVM